MHSALGLVAFASGCTTTGIAALLETAIEALDQSGDNVSAALVEMALEIHMTRAEAVRAGSFEGLVEHG